MTRLACFVMRWKPFATYSMTVVVANRVWEAITGVVGFQIGLNFESMAKCWLCNKKYGVVNMISAGSCLLKSLESKKFSLFPGRCLVRYEGDLVSLDTHDEVLEGTDPSENVGWLRRCSQVAGEGAVEAGKNSIARSAI
jgi:hypothetical protein